MFKRVHSSRELCASAQGATTTQNTHAATLSFLTPSRSENRRILDDFREAYWWLRKNTDDDANIMSWWDYGYQISGFSNRTTLVDNNTWNNTHIAMVGKAMASNETEAFKVGVCALLARSRLYSRLSALAVVAPQSRVHVLVLSLHMLIRAWTVPITCRTRSLAHMLLFSGCVRITHSCPRLCALLWRAQTMMYLDVDYVLIIFGGVIGYSGDDINKFLWMVRIAEVRKPTVHAGITHFASCDWLGRCFAPRGGSTHSFSAHTFWPTYGVVASRNCALGPLSLSSSFLRTATL